MQDKGAEAIGKALAQNSTLAILNLSKNNIKQIGATAIAIGLKSNRSLRQLNLLNQKSVNFGDSVLTAFVDMLEENVTLQKITWRVDSRKSFAINKLCTRNNEINRCLKKNLPVIHMLPASLKSSAQYLTPY